MPKKEKEWQGDHPRFKEMICKWNDICDVMGSRQALWVLRVDLNYLDGLDYLDPDRFFNSYLNKFRAKYHQLVRLGKIKEVSQEE